MPQPEFEGSSPATAEMFDQGFVTVYEVINQSISQKIYILCFIVYFFTFLLSLQTPIFIQAA